MESLIFSINVDTTCSMPDRHPFAMQKPRDFSAHVMELETSCNISSGLEKKTQLFAATISDCWFHLYTRFVVSKAVISALLIRRTPPNAVPLDLQVVHIYGVQMAIMRQAVVSIKSLSSFCVFWRCLKHRWQRSYLPSHKIYLYKYQIPFKRNTV